MIRNYVSAFHSTKLYYKVKKLTSTCLTAQDIVLPHKMFLSSGNGLQMPAVGLGTSGVVSSINFQQLLANYVLICCKLLLLIKYLPLIKYFSRKNLS